MRSVDSAQQPSGGPSLSRVAVGVPGSRVEEERARQGQSLRAGSLLRKFLKVVLERFYRCYRSELSHGHAESLRRLRSGVFLMGPGAHHKVRVGLLLEEGNKLAVSVSILIITCRPHTLTLD